ATSITVTAPAGAAGTVDVQVTTPAGTSTITTADRFTYADVTGPPTVTGVTPISGPSTGGTSVVISGTNFGSVSSVQFGSVAATSFTVNSTTQITATAPAGTTTVDVTVVTSRGTSARNAATDQYTFTFSNNGYAVSLAASTAAPAVGAAVNIIVTANKDVGPTAGGTSVVITGTNLTGATAVRFGAANATAFTVNSPTSIAATAPVAAAGAVDVTVTTPTGTSAVGAADQFTYQTPAGPPTVGGV